MPPSFLGQTNATVEFGTKKQVYYQVIINKFIIIITSRVVNKTIKTIKTVIVTPLKQNRQLSICEAAQSPLTLSEDTDTHQPKKHSVTESPADNTIQKGRYSKTNSINAQLCMQQRAADAAGLCMQTKLATVTLWFASPMSRARPWPMQQHTKLDHRQRGVA